MNEKIRSEFKVHLLNEAGLAKAQQLAELLTDTLNKIEELVGQNGREIAIVRTKMQEASFFAKRGLAEQPENQP